MGSFVPPRNGFASRKELSRRRDVLKFTEGAVETSRRFEVHGRSCQDVACFEVHGRSCRDVVCCRGTCRRIPLNGFCLDRSAVHLWFVRSSPLKYSSCEVLELRLLSPREGYVTRSVDFPFPTTSFLS